MSICKKNIAYIDTGTSISGHIGSYTIKHDNKNAQKSKNDNFVRTLSNIPFFYNGYDRLPYIKKYIIN